MQVVILGTSCMQPTKERNHPAMLLTYKGENILFDCGEGTQRQLKIAGIKPARITKMLISHWDGDHVLGIAGLMHTMGASGYAGRLDIYGPVRSKVYMEHLLKAFFSKGVIDFKVYEVKEGKFFENEDFYLEALPLKHNTKVLGYAFREKSRRRINLNYIKKLGIPQGPLLGKLQRGQIISFKGKKVKVEDATYIVKGKKVVYITDTLPCDNAVKLAQGADLLITEATFKSDLAEKAREYMHMTAKEAGLLANQANVKKLVLTHFSQRYKNVKELEEDARDVFDNTEAAEDLMKIKV